MASTNISCEADRQYVETLGMLAKVQKTTIGKLVRQAIDARYSAELADMERRMSLLFGSESANEFNKELEGTNA